MHVGKRYPYVFNRDLNICTEWPNLWPKRVVYASDNFNVRGDAFHHRFGQISDDGVAFNSRQGVRWFLHFPADGGGDVEITVEYEFVNFMPGPGIWRVRFRSPGVGHEAVIEGNADLVVQAGSGFFPPTLGWTSLFANVVSNSGLELTFPFIFWNMSVQYKTW